MEPLSHFLNYANHHQGLDFDYWGGEDLWNILGYEFVKVDLPEFLKMHLKQKIFFS